MGTVGQANPGVGTILPGYDAAGHQTDVAVRVLNATTDSSVTPAIVYGDLSFMPPGATTATIAAGATGPTVIKAAAGVYYGALITSVGAGAPLGYDNASAASGNIVCALAASAAVGTHDTPPAVGVKLANGLTFAGGATMPAMTIFYS